MAQTGKPNFYQQIGIINEAYFNNTLDIRALSRVNSSPSAGLVRDCRRKTDDNECGQSRLTFSFICSEFRFGFSVSPCGPLGRFLAPNKQDLKSEKTYCSSGVPASYGCHSLFEGAGQ